MRSADPSVVFVPSWLLRSVMLADCPGAGPALLILRARSYGISRGRLLRIIDQKGLLLSLTPATATVILLAEPEEEYLRTTGQSVVLRAYWRLLVQGRVQAAVRERLVPATSPQGGSSRLLLYQRIERLGWSVFNDARFVLLRDRLVPPGANDGEVYSRLAAVYLDMWYFGPSRLARYFPAVDDPEQVRGLFEQDVDAGRLVEQSRPVGAADALWEEASPAEEDVDLSSVGEAESAPEGQWTLLERRAARAASSGNDVHAAILHQRSSRRSIGRSLVGEALANPYFLRFVERLSAALNLESEVVRRWETALAPVLARSADSWRNAESRLLYDLQKVCADKERGIYALDGIGWLVTLGRRPLRRRVPAQAMVLTCKHLRGAADRLSRCHLTPAQRREVEGLLREALDRAEGRMREGLRPAVSAALDHSGLRPRHRVEEVAREKLVEEFLDGLVRRGFARIGDLRDTISRNQLKLHDLTGLVAFMRGDQLLQIDRRLCKPLDGVYHPGEAYLRLFQRVSSLLFATPAGRLFTYYGLIPFGGSYLILEVLGHTVGKIYGVLAGRQVAFDHPAYLVLLGLFLLGLVNVEPFRRGVGGSAKAISRGVRRVVRWQGWRLCRRAIDTVMNSPTWRVLVRYGLKPAVVTGLAWQLMPAGVSWSAGIPVLLVIYGAAAVALNSRVFRMSTYVLAHLAVVLWIRLVSDLVAGVYRAVVRLFRLFLERLERTLYSVDEWLRFRGGQGRGQLALKAGLGAVWSIVEYWVRFGVTLLLEPQINPIKHFPVVTVSHKIILPTVPAMAGALERVGFAKVQAWKYATTTAFVIPGVFGFLAWELKENWRLYQANRSRTLRAVRMGSHGETLAQLLRPGVHSGTIPRIFSRLRQAGTEDAGRVLHRQEQLLQHTAESVKHFLDRELAGLLNRHPAWSGTPIRTGSVELAATRIRVALECVAGGPVARLSFEQHDGWIVARIDEPGWMADVRQPQGVLLGLALLGVYQLAGVDLVGEQIERFFAPQAIRWAIRGGFLVVWTGEDFDVQSRYSLSEDGAGSAGGGNGGISSLLLRRRLVNREAWTRLWDLPVDEWDEGLAGLAAMGMSVLPAGCVAQGGAFTPAVAGFD